MSVETSQTASAGGAGEDGCLDGWMALQHWLAGWMDGDK